MGPLRVSAQKAAGRMSAPKMARPDSTVASHAPSAPTVPSSEHARQMAAAMRDAMPSGLVHSTAVTMRLITALNACGAKSKNLHVTFLQGGGYQGCNAERDCPQHRMRLITGGRRDA